VQKKDAIIDVICLYLNLHVKLKDKNLCTYLNLNLLLSGFHTIYNCLSLSYKLACFFL
jgi:hypothetical protein